MQEAPSDFPLWFTQADEATCYLSAVNSRSKGPSVLIEVDELCSGIAIFSAKPSDGDILYVPLEKLLYKKAPLLLLTAAVWGQGLNERSQV